jgi:hypothetical protein
MLATFVFDMIDYDILSQAMRRRWSSRHLKLVQLYIQVEKENEAADDHTANKTQAGARVGQDRRPD